MIEQSAVILELEQRDDDAAMATIEVVRKTACGICGQTSGCGNAIWGKIFAHKSASFKAQNTIGAQVGQSVVVGIDEQAVMKSALLLYTVPLAMMLIVPILVSTFTASNVVAMLGAAFGLFVGYFWVKAHIECREYYQEHTPKILRLDTLDTEEKVIKFQ